MLLRNRTHRLLRNLFRHLLRKCVFSHLCSSMCKHLPEHRCLPTRFLRYFGIFGFRKIFRFFKHLICVSLFSYQCARLVPFGRSSVLFSDSSNIVSQAVCSVNTKFEIFLKRRWRDLNPRTGCPIYTLSRGASSAT